MARGTASTSKHVDVTNENPIDQESTSPEKSKMSKGKGKATKGSIKPKGKGKGKGRARDVDSDIEMVSLLFQPQLKLSTHWKFLG